MSFDKVKPCSLSAKMEDYDQFANHIALKVDEDVGIKRHKKLTGAEQVQPSICNCDKVLLSWNSVKLRKVPIPNVGKI